MYKLMRVMFWVCLLVSGGSQVRASDLTVYASPLGEYMIKVGPTLDESTGLMMEIAAAAFRQARIKVKVAPPMPWARAQHEAMDQPGAILVLLAKTPAREPQWRWLSMVYTDIVYGITIRGNPVFSSFDEIKAKQPRVGLKIGNASESILKGMGVPVEATPDHYKSLLKLFHDRVDVVLVQGMVLYPELQIMLKERYADGLDIQIKDLHRTAIESIPLWIVTSLKTPEAEAKQLQDALERFKHGPEYRAIIRKYEARLTTIGQ